MLAVFSQAVLVLHLSPHSLQWNFLCVFHPYFHYSSCCLPIVYFNFLGFQSSCCPLFLNDESCCNLQSSSQWCNQNTCRCSESPQRRRSRSGKPSNYCQQCLNDHQDQDFSYGTNLKAHPICAICLGSHTQCLHMQCIQNMGQTSCNNGQEVQRQPLLTREQCSHMHGLAKSSMLLQFQARHQTHLFRLWYCLSWSSGLSLSTEGLGRILPTSQMCGNTCYEKQVSCRNTQMLSLAFILVSTSASLPSLSP